MFAPERCLPQPALILDADVSRPFATEIVLDVDTLNIDAASFRQMEESAGREGVAAAVLETVRRRGKQHNDVTGSGGMLLGTVRRVGALAESRGFRVGERVATLASLTLTPLQLERVRAVHSAAAQLDVIGTAIVFASAPLARMPTDLPERLALAIFDVAGAAPQVARRARAGDTVVVLGGGGKSGLLCAVEARRTVGSTGRVLAVETCPHYAEQLRALGVCDDVAIHDARDALAVRDFVAARTEGRLADLSVSCVNVPGAELGAIIGTRDGGKVLYFAMTTSFTAAALGAEGIGRDVELTIGNGFARGHADHTLELVRGEPGLRAVLLDRYAQHASSDEEDT